VPFWPPPPLEIPGLWPGCAAGMRDGGERSRTGPTRTATAPGTLVFPSSPQNQGAFCRFEAKATGPAASPELKNLFLWPRAPSRSSCLGRGLGWWLRILGGPSDPCTPSALQHTRLPRCSSSFQPLQSKKPRGAKVAGLQPGLCRSAGSCRPRTSPPGPGTGSCSPRNPSACRRLVSICSITLQKWEKRRKKRISSTLKRRGGRCCFWKAFEEVAGGVLESWRARKAPEMSSRSSAETGFSGTLAKPG